MTEQEVLSQDDDDYDDLLKFYGTDKEQECVILMPIPSPEEQIKLLKAYDLNPLI